MPVNLDLRNLNSWPAFTLAVVMLCWIVFAVVFLVRIRLGGTRESKRERSSFLGIALQAAGYSLVWMLQRQRFTPIVRFGKPFEIARSIITMALAIGSVWLASSAVRALGKQWSLVARVVEGHKLITEGPYRVVRNPIYTGMLGMLIATGLVVSHWVALLIAVIVYLIGTMIRVKSEEKLLRELFGTQFEEYERRVPAVVPFLF